MHLKDALAALMLGVSAVSLGLVLRRLKKRRRGKKKKQSRKIESSKNDLPDLVSSVGGSSKHTIRFEDLVKLGRGVTMVQNNQPSIICLNLFIENDKAFGHESIYS